jgi:dTMP kinase
MEQTTSRRGLMLAYEGLDGAGKSTQIQLVAKRLEMEGHRVHLQRLNANRLFKVQCRRLNEHDLIGPVEAALMKAAELSGRFEWLQPLLEDGVVLIWDKYVAGSVASDAARGVPAAFTDAIVASFPVPDLTVYLEIAPEQALARKRSTRGPRVMESGLDVVFGSARQAHEKWAAGEIDAETVGRHFVDFQSNVGSAYERYLPAARTLRLDARETTETLANETLRHVRNLLQVALA